MPINGIICEHYTKRPTTQSYRSPQHMHLGYHALTENFMWLFISPDLTAIKINMAINVKQRIIC